MAEKTAGTHAGLIALAIGGFGIGLTEFGIVGLLPEISRDLHIGESTAGYAVSGYALSVALGAIALTAFLSRFKKKQALVGLMVLFILGNMVSALATNFAVLMVGRVIAALCHGAFFGVGAVVAAGLVVETRRAGAIALMFAGLTVANVAGIPLGTLLGQQLGWRSTFWAITIIGVLSLVGMQLLVTVKNDQPSPGIRSEMHVFRRRPALASALVSVLTFGSMVGAYTYIAFTLTDVTGFAESTVPLILLLFGAGTFLGNLLGGRLADRALDKSLALLILTMSALLAVFALGAGNKALTLVAMFILGTVGFATAPGLQLRVMRHAEDVPTMASGLNIAALNIGNALGAWIGGLTIALGLGYVSPLWVGAALGLAALVVLALSVRTGRSGPSVDTTSAAATERAPSTS
ncbi:MULTISPECIES: MFS transporter [Nocardiaceae]|uniref:DHA1 family inner membrane transport protein n=1 Tax=Rhodococcoides corynebacterioides TaxID=53972 RepID=A0ABS2KUC8_9NOCA|nr:MULTISPECIES: MFS transporter [Rhodococcus]MBM7415537.1 DHA1 family inner membrane transport protein [Rhodococcus corynebacterioides]MBP1117999.1 DHA1 family inner membrane transport protein [Rhodococcus sp. PvP016]